MKRAFTLMEVNLAVFIMAVGVLAMVGLYPLGFRETSHAREDIAAAAMADAVLNPLVGALSSTNMLWSQWIKICDGNGGNPKVLPDGKGWMGYCRSETEQRPLSFSAICTKADEVINVIQRAYSASSGQGDAASGTDGARTMAKALGEMCYAVVASYATKTSEDGDTVPDYSTITLCLRACRHPMQLFTQPVFYTEVHFQGDPTK